MNSLQKSPPIDALRERSPSVVRREEERSCIFRNTVVPEVRTTKIFWQSSAEVRFRARELGRPNRGSHHRQHGRSLVVEGCLELIP